VRLFLDSSVLLAASGSEHGASREVFRRARARGWSLLATPYVVEEVLANLPKLRAAATGDWARLRLDIALMDDVLTLDRAASFAPSKDRPVL
jgi:predicted nucleic acid-binding protein